MSTKKYANYIVHYVEDCEPKLALFYMRGMGEDWVQKFLLEKQQCEDSFICTIFIDGELIYHDCVIGVDESEPIGEI